VIYSYNITFILIFQLLAIFIKKKISDIMITDNYYNKRAIIGYQVRLPEQYWT